MRASLITLLVASAALAQQPAVPDMKLFASSADVQALIANAKKIRTEGQALVSQPIVALAPYRASLEYRASIGTAAIHEKEAELFYVIDGTATLVTGGKIVNEKRINPDNLNGTAIEGGASRPVAKGDFFMVPEGTAHWFSEIQGVLVLMTLHLPRTSGDASRN
jgi:mannose-6-phosphate isomerase-like protein (cupin superfamily)